MKIIITYCFDKWWRPLLFFAFIAALLIINSELNIRFLKKPLNVLSDISFNVILISFIYQLINRRYLEGFLSLFIVFMAAILTMMMTMIDGDHWADDLEIPTDISIDNPIDMYRSRRPSSTYRLTKNHMDLILYNSNQPGIYEFDFWVGKIDKGTIYLKAFEITQEDELSSDNLKKQSKVHIVNTTDTFKRIQSTGKFKIYEGDWGKYYAARFEVWFIPTNGRQEKKLFEKNFKIEGWMH